jgi:hypothetical protein
MSFRAGKVLGEEKNSLFLVGFELKIAQPVVMQYMEYGIQTPFQMNYKRMYKQIN